MAVTGFWPIYRNLKATLDYADNPDKTTLPEYLDEDLYTALRYVENDNKTDRQVFVGGINCSKQNAYAEMIAVQRRFGLRGKVFGYHGIQSFREGEVTPEQAFEIGKETARRMWGARYQVLVSVHLNTDNIHCHFVVNPVSFKDGTKFQNKIGDHKELRRVSDQICREHGLSVLENSDFYSKGKTITVPFKVSERYPEFKKLVKKAEKWWKDHVETGISPAYDEKADAEILKELRTNTLNPESDIEALLKEGEELKTEIDRLSAPIEPLEKRLKVVTDIIKQHALAQFRDGDKKVSIRGEKYEWNVSRSETSEIDKDGLKADGLLAKYTRAKVSYRITTKAIEEEA